MIPGRSVSLTYEWFDPSQGGEDSVALEVEARLSARHPAVYHLRNGDPGWPAEGGEVEELVATLPDGSLLDPIPDDLYDRLADMAEQEDLG